MNPEQILSIIENLTKRQFLPIIGPHKAKVFRKILKKYKPKTVLEIGTLIGYSTIVIASELPKNGKLISIEINDDLARIARENIRRVELDKKVKVLVGDAKKIIPKLKQKFDLVFIDAIKEEYLDYLKLAEKNLKKGSIVIADNAKIFAKDMEDYLDYVRNSGNYKSKYIDVPLSGDGIEISLKN